jgi:hypothetical protein
VSVVASAPLAVQDPRPIAGDRLHEPHDGRGSVGVDAACVQLAASDEDLLLPTPIVDRGFRSAGGATFPKLHQDAFAKIAAERGYKSPFWLTEQQLPAFATSIKPGEVGVPFSRTTLPKAADSRRDHDLDDDATFVATCVFFFNAEQTLHPERFTAENCKKFWRIFSLYGNLMGSTVSNKIRGHVVAHGLPRDSVWSSREGLSRRGIGIRDDAVPFCFEGRYGQVALYGESMTNNAQGVLSTFRKTSKSVFP